MTAAPDAGRHRPLAIAAFAAIALLAVGYLIGSLVSQRDTADTPPPSGSVDVGFAQDMSAHHAQAVEMAGLELAAGTDPAVKNLAYDILTTQQAQLGRMEGWLTIWGRPSASAGGHMRWMPHAHGSMPVMPGMASAAELTRLRSVVGAERDTQFLQLMLRHHAGGAGMLQVAAEQAQEPYVRQLAQQMQQTQAGETRLLEKLLAERNAPQLPMN